jgi:hypothetical protein
MDVERSCHCVIKSISQTLSEGTEENREHLGQNRQSPGGDLNQTSPIQIRSITASGNLLGSKHMIRLILMVLRSKITDFWDMIPSSVVERYQCFGVTAVSIFRVRTHSSKLKMEAVGSSEILALVYKTTRCHIPEECNFKDDLLS